MEEIDNNHKPEYGNWDDLCFNKKKINDEIDILIQRSKTAREFILKINITSPDNVRKIIGALADDTYEFNSFHSLCKLLKMVSPNKDIRNLWDKTDRLLNSHVEKFNTDKELFTKLLHISNYISKDLEWDNNDKLFIDKILKGFAKYGFSPSHTPQQTKAIIEVLREINSLEEKILHSPNQMNKIHSLIILRNKYVKLLGYDTYMGFRSELDMVSLKTTLHKIITENIDQRCWYELQTICNSLHKEKISIDDVIHYREKLNSKYTINLSTALDSILNIISTIFHIEFNKQKKSTVKTWECIVNNNPKVIVYSITYKKETYGYLYVDLVKDKKLEKLSNPLSINLHESVHYPNGASLLKLPVMVLLANLDPDSITYLDIINIFKEMGQIVHTLFHRSKYENINVDFHMRSFMGYLFEHIAFDLDSIKKIFPNNSKEIHAGIIGDKAFKLKQQCISTLFDCVVHGPKKLDNWQSLIAEYEHIYKAIMNKSLDQCILPFGNNSIPPNIIVNLIFNGGIIYSEITNSIMAYNLYVLLKETKGFEQFVNKVLRESLIPFDVAIRSFITERILIDEHQHENKNLNLNDNKNTLYLSDEENNGYNKNNSFVSNKNKNNRYISENTNYFTEN